MTLSLRDKSILYRELSKLVKSGFGIDKSADLLAGQSRNRRQRDFAQRLAARLREGESVAAASRQPQLGTSALEHSIVDASERGGVLEAGFAYLHEYFESLVHIRRTVFSRSLYPLLLLHLAVFLPILPAVVLGDPLAAALRNAVVLLLVLYGAAILAFVLGRLLLNAAAQSLPLDRALRCLPLIGGARRHLALERFTNVFRVYVLSSLRFSDGLAAAGTASRSAVLAHASSALAAQVERGGAMRELLPELRAFPADFSRSLANAELVGNLEEDLASWSTYYRQAVENQLARLATVLPMLFTILVMLYVAWAIVSTYASLLHGQMRQLEDYW
jgi:type II secretory pathway component PulF